MDKSFKVIGGDSGYTEIEIDDDFTVNPSAREIQMVEENLLLIKRLIKEKE